MVQSPAAKRLKTLPEVARQGSILFFNEKLVVLLDISLDRLQLDLALSVLAPDFCRILIRPVLRVSVALEHASFSLHGLVQRLPVCWFHEISQPCSHHIFLVFPVQVIRINFQIVERFQGVHVFFSGYLGNRSGLDFGVRLHLLASNRRLLAQGRVIRSLILGRLSVIMLSLVQRRWYLGQERCSRRGELRTCVLITQVAYMC